MALGVDTFRHGLLGGSSMLRGTLYEKNAGDVTVDHVGLLRTESPLSGSLLLSRGGTKEGIKDPIAGTILQLQGHTAVVTAPSERQQFVRSRKFYLTRDVDVTLQTLRNTTKVNRWTNEKVGTAGTSTGMDDSLRAFKELQNSQS